MFGKRLALAVTAIVASGWLMVPPAMSVQVGVEFSTTTGAVINVPGDQPTLAAAVGAAASGDTILLAPGTHQGGVWVQDKVLTIASRFLTTGDTSYIGQTIVDGYGSGYCGGASGCAGNAVIEFGSRAHGSRVVGLTVRNGVDGVRSSARVDVTHSQLTLNEDGIDYGSDSGGEISDNVFLANTDDGLDLNNRVVMRILRNTIKDSGDDGIEFRMYPYAGPVLEVDIIGNEFIHNDSDGIQLIDSPDASSRVVRIEGNLFTGTRKASIGCMGDQNTSEDYSGSPLAERVYVINNTFTAEHYGLVGGANTIAVNNIFTGLTGPAVRRVGGNSIVAHALFWQNAINTEESVLDAATFVYADPSLKSDYTLDAGSPAIDAGTASYTWLGELVVSKDPGTWSGSAPDLGAFEFSSDGTPTNAAPQVNAGADQSVTLPAGAVLDATVTDDGQPTPPTLTTAWTVVSGPDTVTFVDPAAVDTTATFASEGIYVLALAANDGALSTSDTVQVTVAAAPAPGSGSTERRIAASSDDAEESATGSLSLSSTDLELVNDGSDQTVGLRFPSLALPAGATITRAWVQFEADEAQSVATTLTIAGQAADNPPTFSSAAKISSRPRTSAKVNWSPAAWSTVGQAGLAQQTPDLKGVVQEVVRRTGWATGNALVLIITGTGHRTARAWDGVPAGAPLLHVEYSTGGPAPNAAPQVSAGPDLTVALADGAVLDGTITDDGLPTSGRLTTAWTVVSGPGTVTFTNPTAADTAAAFSDAGLYVLQLSASDGELSASDSAQVTVQAPAPPGSGTVERRVAASSDDAEESATGSLSLTSTDLELVYDKSLQKVGLRFRDLAIPSGATITSAWVQFGTDEKQSEATALTIKGQAADNAPTFSSAAKVGTRSVTSASVAWSPAAWLVVGETGANQRTPDLTGVIQEVVGRAGWASGNAIALVITGTGHRTARSFDRLATEAPLLHIEFSH